MMPTHNSLVDVLRALSSLRAQGQLMFPREWHAYHQALKMGSVSGRMVVAAEVRGGRLRAPWTWQFLHAFDWIFPVEWI